MKNNELCIGGAKYSIDDRGLGITRNNKASYYKRFTIDKDTEYWSVVDIGVTEQVCTGWKITIKQDVDLNDFLSKISPYVIKRGIYNNEIRKIGEDGKIESSYIFMLNPATKNPYQKKVCSTPEETIEYYKKEAEKIDEHRIGFV